MAGHLVVPDASPDDGVRHHRIRPYKDDRIGELQVLQRVAGRVISVSTLMGHSCAGHAETGVAVHVGLEEIPHNMPEDREFFQGQLPGTNAGDTFFPVFFLELQKLFRHMGEALVPGHFFEAAVSLTDLRQSVRFHRGLLLAEGESLDAAEPVIHRIPRRGHSLYDAPVFNIEIEITVDCAEIAGGLHLFHRTPPWCRVKKSACAERSVLRCFNYTCFSLQNT